MNNWQQLKMAWESARTAAITAQQELDDAFEAYLNEGTQAPLSRMQEIAEDLRYLEAEARGRMDQYISENAN